MRPRLLALGHDGPESRAASGPGDVDLPGESERFAAPKYASIFFIMMGRKNERFSNGQRGMKEALGKWINSTGPLLACV
jgi:hypothetical protein